MTLYAAGLLSAFLVVELLRRHSGSLAAAGYVECIALSVVLGSFLEFGLPGKIQWSLLSFHVTGKHVVADEAIVNYAEATNESYYEIPSLYIRLKVISGWILMVFRSSYSGSAFYVTTSIIAIFVISGYLWYGNAMGLKSVTLILILGIQGAIRKIGCAILDGQRHYDIARLIYTGPQILLLASLFFIYLFLPYFSLNINSVLWMMLTYNFISLLVLLKYVTNENFFSMLPAVSEIGESSSAKSIHWHAMAVAGALQQQLFFIVAPFFDFERFTLFFFYAQKAGQAMSEIASQMLRTLVCDRDDLHKYSPANYLPHCLTLAMLAVLGAYVGMATSIRGWPALKLVETIFLVDVYIGALATMLGYIALYFGGGIPYKAHIANGILQVAAAPVFTMIFGMLGLPMTSLAVGLSSSYLANFRIFLRSCRENPRGSKTLFRNAIR